MPLIVDVLGNIKGDRCVWRSPLFMGKKGSKSKRGIGELYDEPKSVGVYVVLTPTGLRKLDALADHFNLTRSETIERLGRGTLPILALLRYHIARSSRSD